MKLQVTLLVKWGPCVALAMLAGLAGCGGGGSSLGPDGTPRIKVACVGDSITDGNGKFTPYPNTLGDWLGGQYQVGKFGEGGATLLNSGQRPFQQTKSFSRAVQFVPNIVVIDLGTNDRGDTFTPALKSDFKRDYLQLIAAFKVSNPAVKVYTCLPTPSYPAEGTLNTTLSTEILPLVQEVAQSSGAQVIDLNAPLIGHPELFPDGVHPTDDGARLIASEVYRALTGVPYRGT